jgi:hypothetical protein
VVFNTIPVDCLFSLAKVLTAVFYGFDYDGLDGLKPGLEIQVSDDAFVSSFEVKHVHGDRLFNHVIYTKHLFAAHVPWAEDGGKRRQFPQCFQDGIVGRPLARRVLTGNLTSSGAPGPYLLFHTRVKEAGHEISPHHGSSIKGKLSMPKRAAGNSAGILVRLVSQSA